MKNICKVKILLVALKYVCFNLSNTYSEVRTCDKVKCYKKINF